MLFQWNVYTYAQYHETRPSHLSAYWPCTRKTNQEWLCSNPPVGYLFHSLSEILTKGHLKDCLTGTKYQKCATTENANKIPWSVTYEACVTGHLNHGINQRMSILTFSTVIVVSHCLPVTSPRDHNKLTECPSFIRRPREGRMGWFHLQVAFG